MGYTEGSKKSDDASTMKLHIALKRKVLILIVMTMSLLGIAAAIGVFLVTDRILSNLALRDMESETVERAATIGDTFADAMVFTKRIASHEIVVDYFRQKEPQRQDGALLEYLEASDIKGAYQAIYVMDRMGTTLTSTDPAFVGQNYGFRKYFQKALAGEPTMDTAIGVTSNKFGYYFAHPVKDAAGRVIGVVIAKLKEQLIADALQTGEEGRDGMLLLVDEYGVVIQSDKPAFLFKSLGALTPEARETIAATKRFNAITITALPYDQIETVLQQLQGVNSFRLHTDLYDRDELISVSRVPNAPFFMVIGKAMKGFMQAVSRDMLKLMGIIAMAMMLAAGILIGVITFLLKPLAIIRHMAVQMNCKGNARPIEIKTGDEFEEVAALLNAIEGKLKRTYQMTEEALWEHAADFEKFKLAVESASDHIIITDIDGRIIHANRAAETITGYARNEMIGNRPSLWGREMSKGFYQTMWTTIKDQKRVFHAEVTNRRKNGERYAAEVHIAPLLTDEGHIQGFVGIERDITAQKNADRAKTEFVSIASHQLRTPLAAINWYVEMLSDEGVGTINETQRKYLDQIHAASTRMVDMVSSLLNVSRIDMGSLRSNPEPVLLSDIADSVIAELEKMAKKKGVTIIKKYDPMLEPINVDMNMARVMFQNILFNAIKYTPEKGLVTLSIKREGEAALITISDTGYGIPADQQPKIFTKFFRARNAREKEPEGSGLGLYITKAIVEHAQGTIKFSSEEGKGTEFRIFIPPAGMDNKGRQTNGD